MTRFARGRAASLMVIAVAALAVALFALPPVAAHAQGIPAGWRHRPDRAAGLSAAPGSHGDTTIFFVSMAPGFHITTGPGTLLYEPSVVTGGPAWAVESDGFTFPGQSRAGVGVFFGGQGLDGATPRWTAFLIRRDGAVGLQRADGSWVVPWTPHPAVKAVTGDEPMRNTLRVTAAPDSVRFSVNGTPVFAVAAGTVATEGQAGFRVGADMNVHLTTFDHLRRLAPIPPPRPRSGTP